MKHILKNNEQVVCISVALGWVSAVKETGERFGPTFATTNQLWKWQKENIIRLNPVVETALDIAKRYGGIDGAHHKAWVIEGIAP